MKAFITNLTLAIILLACTPNETPQGQLLVSDVPLTIINLNTASADIALFFTDEQQLRLEYIGFLPAAIEYNLTSNNNELFFEDLRSEQPDGPNYRYRLHLFVPTSWPLRIISLTTHNATIEIWGQNNSVTLIETTTTNNRIVIDNINSNIINATSISGHTTMGGLNISTVSAGTMQLVSHNGLVNLSLNHSLQAIKLNAQLNGGTLRTLPDGRLYESSVNLNLAGDEPLMVINIEARQSFITVDLADRTAPQLQ
ncbi:MAG: hypothetical protein FWE37_04515 [Spirochaetaceae bacterium]|nr:hypothetical protein [Spirochaetaceae bacterium]